jgi:hypothetical protein
MLIIGLSEWKIYWDVTPRNPLKVIPRFVGILRPFSVLINKQTRNYHEAYGKQSSSFLPASCWYPARLIH